MKASSRKPCTVTSTPKRTSPGQKHASRSEYDSLLDTMLSRKNPDNFAELLNKAMKLSNGKNSLSYHDQEDNALNASSRHNRVKVGHKSAGKCNSIAGVEQQEQLVQLLRVSRKANNATVS